MPANVTRITPILILDAIEPSLPFWQALGFEVTATVPHGERLGFAMLAQGGTEIMLQTLASSADDHAGVVNGPTRDGVLFIEVADLDAVIAATKGAPTAVPRRQTFYGMDEIGVRDPAGNVVMFAMPVKK